MSRTIGFIGTSEGAKPDHLRGVEECLAKHWKEGFGEFHHGHCVGADEQPAKIAKALGLAHPGLAEDSADLGYRSALAQNDEVPEAKPFAAHDRDIVDVV